MDERLPWFRSLPAAQRSWVTLVAQAGIAGYVGWASAGLDGVRLTEAVFGSAPRELIRSVSLRRTVELVRIAISVAEEHLPALGTTPVERAALADSLLRYSREVAFSAAAVYAAAAESRGALDLRLEALVVDALVRGEDSDALASRAAALNWNFAVPVSVLVGSGFSMSGPVGSGYPRSGDVETDGGAGGTSTGTTRAAELGAAVGATVLSGVHGDRLILVLSAPDGAVLDRAAVAMLGVFGDGPVVRGPTAVGLSGAINSARQALAGIHAIPAWPEAPRGIDAEALLPERVLDGDQTARHSLQRNVYQPLLAAGDPLLDTLSAYLGAGRSLEAAARSLFVHANTVRYRLRRIAEITGLDATGWRDALTLQVALTVGRLADGP